MSGQARNWDRYKKMQSEEQQSTWTAHRRCMEDVGSNDLKDNPKRCWSFIKSKRQECTGVVPLMNKDAFLQGDPAKKTEILNQQVYTKEDPGSIPDKVPSPFSSMEDIKVNPNGMKKLLNDLSPFKDSGSDGIHTFTTRCRRSISS